MMPQSQALHLNLWTDSEATYVSINRVMKLRLDLSEASAVTLGFHQVWPDTTDIRQQAQLANQFSRWHAKHDKEMY